MHNLGAGVGLRASLMRQRAAGTAPATAVKAAIKKVGNMRKDIEAELKSKKKK